MNASRCHALALAALLLSPALATAAAVLGQPAPAFELKDTDGKTVRLADFKGRHVVLEWTNPGCPFVQKHYQSRNMPTLQKELGAKQVAWLSINSTAQGSSDHLAPAALKDKLVREWGAAPTAVLMDESGQTGKAYAARTTPHLYVVNPAGVLVYAGGIDDKRSANPADIPGARNHVRAALDELLAGKPVSRPSTPPYGCSIKYAD